MWLFVVLMSCLYAQHRAAYAEVRLYTGINESRLFVPDHGFVHHCQIDNYYRDSPRQVFLAGITSFNSCCSRDFTTDGKEIGWWFYPNGTEVPKFQEHFQWSFFTSRYERIVFLYRRRGGASGIHRLDIPVSAAENETFYVGLYPSEDSSNPNVTSMQFNLTSEYTVGETPKFSVTCNSEGGPATMVTWTRDGEAVSGGNFTATRRLDDPVTAAYTLTLSVAGRQGGVYRCQVAKSGPGVSGDPVNSSMELEVKVADPPTGLTAVKEDEAKVKVSWTPPTGGDTVTAYQIFYQHSSSVIVNASVTQYVITDPELNITHPITMVALSEHLPSEVVGPVTPISSAEMKPHEEIAVENMSADSATPLNMKQPHAENESQTTDENMSFTPPNNSEMNPDASENDSHNEDWRIIVCGVLGGAGISIASAVVVILLFLLRASKQKNDRFEMTKCEAYEEIQLPDHVHEGPQPGRQCATYEKIQLPDNVYEGPLPVRQCATYEEVQLPDHVYEGPLPVRQCATYEEIQLPDHVYEGPLPVRQCAASNVTSTEPGDVLGCDGTLQNIHESHSST